MFLNYRFLSLLPVIFVLFYSSYPLSAEEKDTAPTDPSTTVKKDALSLKFEVDLNLLAADNTADDFKWLEIDSHPHLLLIHNAKGRKPRGNVLLLHAQGENPDHQRFIQPISHQLTRLGWKVFVPSFAREDFAAVNKNNNNQSKQTASEKAESPNNEPKPEKTSNQHHFFKSSDEYQSYYGKVCQSIFQQTQIKQKPLLIIANQNAAYWGLSCLKMLDASSPIIFIHPQLPQKVKNDLEQRFSENKNPYFSFHRKNAPKDPFMQAFKKQVWRTKYLRFNIGMYSGNKLASEDNQLAKTITGWLERQRKNKKQQ